MLKLLFIDIILDILYFPLWWYSKGLFLTFKWMIKSIAEMENFVALKIWIKNIFTPMFGQRDIAGKIISFFMRVFQIIFRAIILLAISVFYFIIFFVYLILPVVVLLGIFIHIESFI